MYVLLSPSVTTVVLDGMVVLHYSHIEMISLPMLVETGKSGRNIYEQDQVGFFKKVSYRELSKWSRVD